MNKFDESLKPRDSSDPLPWDQELKVFFCSRTHSQLSQLVAELRKVKMPPGLPPDLGDSQIKSQNGTEVELTEDFKHLALGSRRHLCINPQVKNASNVIAINEKCQELLQHGGGCDYLPDDKKTLKFHEFRDRALANVRDIEDLGRLGKDMSVCPYYASREVVDPSEVSDDKHSCKFSYFKKTLQLPLKHPASFFFKHTRAALTETQIISLPYPLLLHKSARQALNISLTDQIVIIDEAHNLVETITELHSASISLAQIKRARHQVSFYLSKFLRRFTGKNRVYLAQLLRLIDSLRIYLESRKDNAREPEGVVRDGDLLASKNADQINIDKLQVYMRETKLAFKLDGYEQYLEAVADKDEVMESTQQRRKRSSAPCLSVLENFMSSLTYPSREGRFFYSLPELKTSKEDEVLLRYILLDPVHHFQDIVQNARAVILAGGTMAPMDDYFQHLFPYVPASKIMTLSCGHVIPHSNLLAMPIGRGPQGTDLCFRFGRRDAPSMLQDLGLAILKTAEVIPDGLVVFFPSYAYLNTAMAYWQRDRCNNQSLWDRLSAVKPIFTESTLPPSSTSQPPTPTPPRSSQSRKNRAASVLAAYIEAIHACGHHNGGALLLAVIGGSLSEGINFSDRLGRGVIVVGLPYPNRHAPEWAAKLEFVAQHSPHSREKEQLKSAFITNTAMRSVNQSIGRAIRHANDYAAILLFDNRYFHADHREKLPRWIRESLVVERDMGFDEAVGRLRAFFRDKKEDVV